MPKPQPRGHDWEKLAFSGTFHETPHVQRSDEVRKGEIPKNRGRLKNGNSGGSRAGTLEELTR